MSAPEIINPPGGGGGGISGSGTAGKLAKFTGATALGDSLLSESGTTITSAATAETFGSAQTWTLGAPNSQALVVLSNAGLERTLVLDTIIRGVGIGGSAGTLLHVQDNAGFPFAGSTYEGVRLQRSTEALFSASDYTRSFRAGLTGATAVVGTSTAHDLLLQRGNVTALTLGASGAVAFAGNLTSGAAQTWTLANSATALNIQSGLLNLDTTNSRVGIGTASPGRKLVVNDAAAETFLSIRGLVGGSSGLLMGDTTTEVLGVVRVFTSGPGIYLGAGNNQHLSINATGNVGIGTASPSSLGTNYTTLDIRGSAGGGIRAGTPSIMSYMYADASGWNVATSTALPIIFYTNNTERARIDSSGNLILNTVNTGATIQAAGTNQGLKLPAAPGNTDPNTLDCYAETDVSSGYTLSGVTATSGAITVAIRATRIGRTMTFAISIAPAGGASLTFAAGWYLTMTGVSAPAFAGGLAVSSNDATVTRGTAWVNAVAGPTVYGSAAVLGANVSLFLNGTI